MYKNFFSFLFFIFFMGLALSQHTFINKSWCQTTVEIETAESNKLEKMEQETHEQLFKIRIGLNNDEKRLLDIMQQQFEAYERDESDRISLMNTDGTDRGIMGIGECQYLVKRHQQRIKQWLVDKSPVQPFSDEEFHKADMRLFKAYRGVLSWGDWHNRIHDMSYWDKNYVADYQNDCANAEKAWIKYREAWTQLLKLLRPEKLSGEKTIESSVKTSLTLDRIEELKSDPD